ncbi:MAG: AraC family transcriptional regulator, partial [Methylococcaceae bacterium]|nr:AraC family transcriptional regulator [Methylococcaceae bacterium]
DKDIAKLAQDILFNEFKNPPSVEALSKRVGTNQFKLKKMFHHFFNNTPYGLLLEIRMNNAYRLLESTRCHVSVAADFVGYSHASNFSAAFIRHFGISPKAISKKQ